MTDDLLIRFISMQNQNNQQEQEQQQKQQKFRTIKNTFLQSKEGFQQFIQNYQNNTKLSLTTDSDEFIDLLIEEFHKWWESSKIQMPFDKFCIKIDKVQPKVELINEMLYHVKTCYPESNSFQYKRKNVTNGNDDTEQDDFEDHYDFEILDAGDRYRNLDDLSSQTGDNPWFPDPEVANITTNNTNNNTNNNVTIQNQQQDDIDISQDDIDI